MNILTFDIEEWYIEKHFHGGRKEKFHQYDEILDWILATLEEKNIKATFFCVGQLAVEFPEVVKRITSCGHEIGSHSNRHLWVTKMSRDEFSEDTKVAIQELENLIGIKVKSFRAPAFSIGQDNDWAFEILAENGIEYDASVFPAKREFGGFPHFGSSKPSMIIKNGMEIKEFPITPAYFLKRKIPFSGGGYFRFMPISIQKYFINQMDYVMFYFHINDLIEEKFKFKSKNDYEEYYKEVGSWKNRLIRYVKSNIGKGVAKEKLNLLLDKYDFVNVEQASELIDWSKQTRLTL